MIIIKDVYWLDKETNEAIDALATKNLKLQDVPIEGGTLSAEYGKLVDETNGNPSNKQIRKWAKKKPKIWCFLFRYN